MRAAKYMIGISNALYTTLLVTGMVKHVKDATWPVHARFHTMQAQFSAAGLGLVSLIIAFTSFPKKEKWAWWALLISAHTMYTGGFWASYFTTGDGPPGMRTFFTTALFTALNVVGLAMSSREIFGANSQAPAPLAAQRTT